MLRFSANLSLLFTDRPLLERFAAARAAGFEAIEIQFPYDHTPEQLAEALARHQLDLVLINVEAGDLMQGGLGLAGIPGREQAFRRAVLQAMPYVSLLSVPCVNVLAGRLPPEGDLLHCLHTLTANARYAAEAFQSLGATTVLEAINTHDQPGFLVSNPIQLQEILEAADHPTLKMQLDCYHLARMGLDPIEALLTHHADVAHIQFADAPDRGPPGTGHLPYGQIFDVIERLPYRGWCGAEYHPGPAGTEASLASWAHWRTKRA